MAIWDDVSGYAWMYFVSHKSDCADAFKKGLVNRREAIPSEVILVRSGDADGSNKGKVGNTCRGRSKTADNPEYNVVAEWWLIMIEPSAIAAKVQASGLFLERNVPKGLSLWAERINWAYDTYN